MKVIILLFLTAIAKGVQRRTEYGCEGGELNIQCELGTTIHLVRANYGRFSISTCNREGETGWSVNCMEPRTIRILRDRCGSLNSCTVPVNSSIFGDPCPGTFKYVEVHYSCLEQGAGLTTLQERPPWLLDLTATPEPAWQVKHLLELNSSLQTSTRTSVTSPGTPSTQAGSPVVPGVHAVQGEPGEQGEPGVNLTDSVPTNPYSGWDELKDESRWRGEQADDEYDPDQIFTLGSEPCSRTFSRGVLWTWDGEEREVVQPCPSDALGVATWSCLNQGWDGESPNLSGCKSTWITELARDIDFNSGERVLSDLAAYTRSKALYGGDILQTMIMFRTLRLEQEQKLKKLEQREQREAKAAEFFHSVLLTGNNLLRTDQYSAWKDLELEQRAAAGSSFIQEMFNTATVLATNLGSRDRFEQRTEHVQNSLRVFNSYPEQDLEFLDLGGTQTRVQLRVEDLTETRDSIEPIQLIFFSYDGLDKVLPSSSLPRVRFLNSDIVSVLYARKTQPSLTFPLRVTLEHRQRNLSSSSCVSWDTSSNSWTESGCQVESTNQSHTMCNCDRSPATIALLAEMIPAGEELNEDLGSLLGILLAVVTGVFLTFLIVLLTWKFCVHRDQDKRSRVYISCICKDGDEDYYPNINSSPTSTTLSDDPTQTSNYSLGKDLVLPSHVSTQSFQPPGEQCQIHRPLGQQSLYRSITQRSDRHSSDLLSTHRSGNSQSVYRLSDQQSVYRLSDQQSMYRTLIGDESSAFRSEDQSTLYRLTAEPGTLHRPAADHGTLHRPGVDPSTMPRPGAEPGIILRPGTEPTLYRTKRQDINTLSGVLFPIQLKDETNHYFRPVSPSGHIYMEIDPIFSGPQTNQDGDIVFTRDNEPDFQPSDASDDDLRRGLNKTISRYSEDQPLLRTPLRRSNPVRSCQVHSTFTGLSRFGPGETPNLETPITIALNQEGNEYVSLNLQRGFGRRTLPPEFCKSKTQLRRK